MSTKLTEDDKADYENLIVELEMKYKYKINRLQRKLNKRDRRIKYYELRIKRLESELANRTLYLETKMRLIKLQMRSSMFE